MSIDALLFAPSKPAAAAELARILTPGGRLVLTSWDYHSQPAGRAFQITDHRPLLDRAGAAAPDARHLHPHRRGAAPVYELGEEKLFGHIKPRKNRARFLEFCRYLRSLYLLQVRITIVCDSYSPHLTTRKDKRAGQRAAASNTEIACTPTNSSWWSPGPT